MEQIKKGQLEAENPPGQGGERAPGKGKEMKVAEDHRHTEVDDGSSLRSDTEHAETSLHWGYLQSMDTPEMSTGAEALEPDKHVGDLLLERTGTSPIDYEI